MSEPSFQIVFRGKILGGFDRAQVRANLAQLFKSSGERIEALLDAPKTVLKTGLSKDAATRYQDALRQAGIMVAVVSDAPVSVEPTPTATAGATPSENTTSTPVSARPIATRAMPAEAASEAITTIAGADAGLSLAPAGTVLLPPQDRKKVDIDTSALSLGKPGEALIEKKAVAAPEFDLSGISLANDDGPIDRTPKSAAADIDVSALSLSEQPVEAERELSALQKLLSASVD